MEDCVRRLIESAGDLSSAFQPIVSLRGERPLGYEVLLRLPPGASFAGPAEAFDAAAVEIAAEVKAQAKRIDGPAVVANVRSLEPVGRLEPEALGPPPAQPPSRIEARP